MLNKAWAKPLLIQMGLKVLPLPNYLSLSLRSEKSNISDSHAEVIMNGIPPCLIINWDQTVIHLVPVSGWTMERECERQSPLNDKREITVVLAVILAGEYLPRFSTKKNGEVPSSNQVSI